MVDNIKKIAIIGGGPGGYVAAIRAAQLGAKVTLIEKEYLGGTCLNVGCIPTKALLNTAELFSETKMFQQIGIDAQGQIKVNWNKLQERKNTAVKQLVSGVKGLLMVNKVEVIKGTAEIIDNNTVKVCGNDEVKKEIKVDNIIIASGSLPFIPPIEGTNLPGVIDSTGALSLDKLPEKIVIIGGGVIGVEFATIFNSLGCKVTIVEMLPHILPPVDREMANLVRKDLIKLGVKIYNNAKVTGITKSNETLDVSVKLENEDISISADNVLVAVGRKGNTEGLNLDHVGINSHKGFIQVDEHMETNIQGIYAIGDCIGGIMLAHVASEEGITAVENIMGNNKSMDYKSIPSCVYIKPELASVGLTEEQAKDQGYEYNVGRFPLMANGKAIVMNHEEGMVKILADKKYGQVLGMHIYGERATDLIAEGALAINMEATTDEIINTVHAHPTISEALKETALAVNKRAIHIPNR